MAQRKTRSVQVLNLQTKTTFVDRHGNQRDMNDPHGKPSDKQLYSLWRKGRLAILATPTEPLTKGEVGYALDQINGDA